MRFISILLLIASHCCCLSQTTDTTVLNTVIVRAEKKLIVQKADRIIYDLQADPQSKAGSILEMMKKVPYLSLDANDNVLLKGSSSYSVFIDGRPSGLVAANPTDLLRSIPASTIKSIEVITSPPAKYDAEGLAGIINIITIRQTVNGYRGTANISGKEPARGFGIGSSLTLKHGGLGSSLLAGFKQQRTPEAINELTRLTGDMNPSSLYQYTASRSDTRTAYTSLEISYEADSLNLFSSQISYNSYRSAGYTSQLSDRTTTSREHYRLENNNDKKDKDFDATLSYQRSFRKDKNQLLTFSYRYWKNENASYNDIVLSDRVNNTQPNFRQRLVQTLTEQTIQTDYEQPVRNVTIEAGIKEVFRTTENDFQYTILNSSTGEYEIDPVRSNIFHYNRHVISLYNSYGFEAAGWQLKAGIRAEETIISMNLINRNETFRQQYLDLLPVFVVSKKLSSHNNLAFSYSRRIQRPRTEELNPFADRSNPATETSGNPYLQPIISDVYQLSYQQSGKATLNVSVSGMFFNHVFSQYPTYNAATNTVHVRYENYGRGRVLKINLAFSYPFSDQWSFACNTDVRHVTTLNGSDNLSADNAGVDAYANISGSYRFGREWHVNADITYKKGGLLLPLGRTTGFVASSFSVSKNYLESKLTITASVDNPFTRYRYITETINTEEFLQTSQTTTYYRRFSVNINYRFGQLKADIRKSKRRGDENNMQ